MSDVKDSAGGSILSFLWLVIKPYKWWYLLMLQAPIVGSVYPIIYNYAVKLLIDMFTQSEHITYEQAFYPVLLFVLGQCLIDIAWRLHNYAAWRSIPFVLQRMMGKIFEYVTNHSYSFFQNNLSGSVVSKVKGIGDSYFKCQKNIEYEMTVPLLTAFGSSLALAFVNVRLFCIVAIFILINTPLAIYWYSDLAKIEQSVQDSWHCLFGKVADKIANIFTVFCFCKEAKRVARDRGLL